VIGTCLLFVAQTLPIAIMKLNQILSLGLLAASAYATDPLTPDSVEADIQEDQ
jgi:hypothetical protein